MLLEENQISFHSEDGLLFDGVKDYSRQIAEMLGLRSDSEFPQAGVSFSLHYSLNYISFFPWQCNLQKARICLTI